jgi:hypothetical protein
VIANTGGGTAKQAGYQIVACGRRAAGFIGDGFLASGDKVLVEIDTSADDNAEALAFYLTADDSSWVVTRDSRRRRLRKGREGGVTTGDEAWVAMHPDVPWQGLPTAGVRVQWIEKRGALVPRGQGLAAPE